MDTGARRRSTPAGARRGKPAAAPGAARWGIQLVASGMLFLLVFIGRGVFPGQAEAVSGEGCFPARRRRCARCCKRTWTWGAGCSRQRPG